MKCIACKNTRGDVDIIRPFPGERLAVSVEVPPQKKIVSISPTQVMRFFGVWDERIAAAVASGAILVEWSESEEEFVARVAAKDVPSGASDVTVVEFGTLPSRRFRKCWTIGGVAVAVDPVKAREQVIAEIRTERDEKLKKSDSDKAKLDDIGNNAEKNAIKQYRQELRDLPAVVKALIAGMDVAALESFTPAWPVNPVPVQLVNVRR